jgi:hypothetical protein
MFKNALFILFFLHLLEYNLLTFKKYHIPSKMPIKIKFTDMMVSGHVEFKWPGLMTSMSVTFIKSYLHMQFRF